MTILSLLVFVVLIQEGSLVILGPEATNDLICLYGLSLAILKDIVEAVPEREVLTDRITAIEGILAIIGHFREVVEPDGTTIVILIANLHWRDMANKVVSREHSEDNLILQ